jgi:hypothetical protein
MNVSVVIPWRSSGDERREANFQQVLAYLNQSVEEDVIVVSDGKESGPFNRSAAYNRGREFAPADVYVWHEADMIVAPAQIRTAIEWAAEAPGLVVPFTDYVTKDHPDEPQRIVTGGRSFGAVGVTSEATMQAVGQWDEGFAGNAFDDTAMKLAFEVCAGPTRFVPGQGKHLWHPPATPSKQNHARWELYLAARNDPERIRELIRG